MGLEDRMRQPVGLLSGGQRQALTLLMATLVPPKLLLLDEHTAALDPATAEKVLALTKKIVADGHITCLMVTHNMHQALELGNRTLMMDGGRIVFDTSGAPRARPCPWTTCSKSSARTPGRRWTTTASCSRAPKRDKRRGSKKKTGASGGSSAGGACFLREIFLAQLRA
jgi:energy-coupling factor transporter ATP-binding protein EcfA2